MRRQHRDRVIAAELAELECTAPLLDHAAVCELERLELRLAVARGERYEAGADGAEHWTAQIAGYQQRIAALLECAS